MTHMNITAHQIASLLVLAALVGILFGLVIGAIRQRLTPGHKAMADNARAHLEELAAVAGDSTLGPAMRAVVANTDSVERARRFLPVSHAVEEAADKETEDVVLAALNRLRQKGRL